VHAVGSDAGIQQTMLGTRPEGVVTLLPPSRTAFPATSSASLESAAPQNSHAIENKINIGEHARAKAGSGRTAIRLFLFLLFVAAVAAAFYGGRRYKGPIPILDATEPPIAAVSPAAPSEDPPSRFEKARLEVDNGPAAWLANQLSSELSRQGIQTPLQSSDPEFLYLYGRATLLTGNNEEAVKAFEAAIAKADLNPSTVNATIRKEATFGLAAVALKSDKDRPAAQAHFDEITRKPSQPASSGLPASSPVSSPPGSPLRSP
jgi:hypothetical protein